jgi:death-on-curing protein
MRFLTFSDIVKLHQRLAEETDFRAELRDRAGLEAAITQPQLSYDYEELYPTLAEKAGAQMLALILNHPFTDGNKRVGYAAAELFLWLNGYEFQANIDLDELAELVNDVSTGTCDREALTLWIRHYSVPRKH